MSERATVKKLVTEARIQLRAKKARDRALELATAADAMLADMQVDAKARADIYASVASLWLELGDEPRSEQRILQAIETEAQLAPARPVILGTQKLFYAKLLYAQQRFADAARYATEGLAIYAQGVAPNHPELARIRADLAPILKHTDVRMNEGKSSGR
jgi:nucleotide-binding universal stress UspA family protein